MTRLFLVTGAAGFVGRQVVKALLTQGHPVRIIARPASNLDALESLALESIVYTPDLFQEDEIWWQAALAGVDTVIHLAWHVEPGAYLHSPKNLDCTIGTLQLVKSAISAGTQRFVGIGTCLEYEPRQEPLSVHMPLAPATPYAAAKTAVFWGAQQTCQQANIGFAWCRLFYLYGEGEHPGRLVPYLHARLSKGEPVLLGKGDQTRDFLDTVEAGRQIADIAGSRKNGAFNICSGIPVTIRELAEKIASRYGRNDLLEFGARQSGPEEFPYIVGVPAND